jgi:hypothetical protein
LHICKIIKILKDIKIESEEFLNKISIENKPIMKSRLNITVSYGHFLRISHITNNIFGFLEKVVMGKAQFLDSSIE